MLETLKEKWNDILKYLKEEYDISDVSFDTWLLPLDLCLEQPGNIVKIIVPDANFLGYIKKNTAPCSWYPLRKLPASNATPSSSL